MGKFFWGVMLGLLLLTRLPAMANYFSIDNVNLALSLEKFDPRIHQPQPPGYPLFVVFARGVNLVFIDAERTFTAISILVSALSLIAAYALASRMFSPWAGAAAASLLLVTPPFWQATLDGPLRPHLALFSLLTAYCSWRCWNGEKRFAAWGALALGVGAGFRPDLLAYLFPLWFASSWKGSKSWPLVVRGLAIIAGVCLVWTAGLVIAMGGVRTFTDIMLNYAVDQSKSESVVLGSSLMAWLRQVNRLVIWNGLAIVAWVWALPFYVRHRERLPATSAQFVFFLIWLVPGLIVQALIHIAAPGHTLFSVAAWCVLGGYALSLAPAKDAALGAALILNLMLFLNFFALPAGAENTAGRTPSLKNAMLFGTFESSLADVRWLDDVTRTTLKEIEQFTPADRPSIIVTTDTYVSQWFMNWRIGRYYLPQRDLWVLETTAEPRRAERIRRDVTLDVRQTQPVQIPLIAEGRILWVIEPGSAFHKELAAVQELKGGTYVFYSDVKKDSPAFKVGGFEITPGS